MDSRATHHMNSLKKYFASLASSSIHHIEVGDFSFISINEKEGILLYGGCINDVLYVP